MGIQIANEAAALDGQIAEKLLDLGLRAGQQLLTQLHLVEVDVPPDPVTVRALGVDGIVFEPHHLPHLVQQLELGIGGDKFPSRPRAPPPPGTWGLTLGVEFHNLLEE
jgi:hypothetical protein